jgi:hypothetical protein
MRDWVQYLQCDRLSLGMPFQVVLCRGQHGRQADGHTDTATTELPRITCGLKPTLLQGTPFLSQLVCEPQECRSGRHGPVSHGCARLESLSHIGEDLPAVSPVTLQPGGEPATNQISRTSRAAQNTNTCPATGSAHHQSRSTFRTRSSSSAGARIPALGLQCWVAQAPGRCGPYCRHRGSCATSKCGPASNSRVLVLTRRVGCEHAVPCLNAEWVRNIVADEPGKSGAVAVTHLLRDVTRIFLTE